MPGIPFAQADHRRFDGSPMRLLNCLYERAPENLEDQVSIIPRPGLTSLTTAGEGPIRGMARQSGVLSGKIIAVSATTAYAVTTAGVAVALTGGTVTGTGWVSVAFSDDNVFVANGTGLQISTNGTTIAAVTVPDSLGVTSLAQLAGYILLSVVGLNQFFWIKPGLTTIGALDYASAETKPGALRRIITAGDEAWLFCDDHIEVWVPSGDGNAPFMRINGRLFEIGIASSASACLVGGTICFIGAEDRRVYRCAETPVRIGDHALEERLRKADPATFRLWGFSVDGHDILVIGFGTDTMAVDLETGLPFVLTSYGKAAFRAHIGCSIGDGRFVAGDAYDGHLWLVDPAISNDNGEALEREWTGVLEVTGAPARCNSVALDCSVGNGGAYPDDDPRIGLCWSDDRGKTWSEWRFAFLGRQGEFSEQIVWKKLGPLRKPGRLFRWRVTDNVFIEARKAKFNESLV